MVETLRKEHIKTPFVFMTYYNIVYAYGRENFLQRMAKVGVQGIIIPDLPFEEDKTFENLTEKYNISIVNLISSNTQIDRSRKILQKEKLFTYLVSVAGTTGARTSTSIESLKFVKSVKEFAQNLAKINNRKIIFCWFWYFK